MRGLRISRSTLASFSVSRNIRLGRLQHRHLVQEQPTTRTITITAVSNLYNSRYPFLFSYFSSLNSQGPSMVEISEEQENFGEDSDIDHGEESEDFGEKLVEESNVSDEAVVRDVKTIVDIIREAGGNRVDMKNKLEQCGVKPTSVVVAEVISRFRNDWETAFTFFVWAEKQPGYCHSIREYHSMICILGKMRKFDTAWSLIDDMRGVRTGQSIVTPHTLLIMIRRYCAAHDVGRAINTFYAYKRFGFQVGIEDFQNLLSALCRYKNVQDAEHLLFCNKAVFPFNAKSFNIILNGWCNVIGSPRESGRIWREMSKRGVRHDVVSYASIMSCYSKGGNLNKVFRLFTQMKNAGIEPDRKVYNAVIHALAKARLVNEAFNLLKTMEEKGIPPNAVTYNSLIKPLCRALKIDDAKKVFDEMRQRNLTPTVRTYHALFRGLRTGEEVFDLLESMKKMGCQPTNDTYIMLIRKFSRWRQFDDVFKVWNEMREKGVGPDRSSYTVLIHGLFLNGKLDEAYKFYIEMKEKQLLPEPKMDGILQEWFSSKQFAERQIASLNANQLCHRPNEKKSKVSPKNHHHETHFTRQPETRNVVRERGFSFLE